ncbi:uncharacterized protein LOC119906226 isoform X1 [Micropterus salmoides]|uniref:uncharacterized protein LOC119906226 isoform X1 n=1 Tax=Micropterus salmoides TaxID=27706 RepID=UPI0018EAC90C|nr:uncharacterized protein LOC119906226 isoform X1 [Micropterus salmoides]
MQSLLTKLVSGKLSTYAVIILMFTYSILLDRDFPCTCKPQVNDCNLYIGLPVVFIFLLILWTDRSFQRVCRYQRSGAFGCCGSFLGYSLRKIVKAALVGVLWVAFVLIEADWYVCCKNYSTEQIDLACKAKENNLTEGERVSVAELKSKSRAIGGSLLLCIIFVASIMPLYRWSKCCEDSEKYFKNEKRLLVEKENALKEILKEVAKEEMNKVKEEIRSGRWNNVAEVLIKTSAGEQRTENQEQQQHPEQQQDQQQEQLRRTDPTQPSRPEAAAGEQDIPLLSMKSGSSNQQ